ncbi:uncharacterized protein LOC100256409 isoform X2 [Vitis vinifera]|uniref:uncharacterized protein LOC100256409 isoform X2 n=1 Tax=Vitis vinifera TaxID=29760 RepID=UPI00053FDF53|nr:uncharacterized protein LOC100256409 isoform X2 [Vitis vinifera]|eukprot:XP_010663036.1 PREDICTED: uncharacterized protein LOC100256409 isoform X2 [Vitis vinifera]
MENGPKRRRRELEPTVLHKVGDVISAINEAKHVDQLICALHSLAVRLFPLDSSAFSGSIDEQYRDQVLRTEVPSSDERSDWWWVFYQGTAFPTLARVLLYEVASNWLACFPISAQKHVYDVFFVEGLATEVVQTLVPCLQHNARDSLRVNTVCLNAERLLVLCLFENDGILQMAREFGSSFQSEDSISERMKPAVSRVAQLMVSIPDKAPLGAPTSLSSHFFFKQIAIQLLAGVEEKSMKLHDEAASLDKNGMDGTFLFVGETFARICRRGSIDVLLGEVIPRILAHIRSCLQSNTDLIDADVFETNPGFLFWSKMMEAIKDPYAVERMSEQILHYLATEQASDTEAYWTLWMLFHQIFYRQKSVRLESPDHLVRRMASSVALVFSKVVDPKNPLHLDDSCSGETIDWEFGLVTPDKGIQVASSSTEKGIKEIENSTASVAGKELDSAVDGGAGNNLKDRDKKLSKFRLVDPDEIIDPAMLNDESTSGGSDDDNASDNSESSNDSSLQPYDLSDDDTDLKKKITQVVDVVGALRKSDDADGVERALDVAENLVRASPDELRHLTGDLVRTLVQVRCSDLTIEGEEESAEEKRQKALVALLVTCPFESLDALHKLLYSPNVDVSQRILILDIMTDAAQELADTRTMKPKRQPGALISTISETQPWFLPSSIGPPGAGSWKEMSGTGSLLNLSYSYERELPPKPNQVKRGKTRRWSLRLKNMPESQTEWSQNKFPLYAAAFMLPAMQGFDKRRHGVDLLARDFIVLGKLIYMLGVCMKCASMHPEASALASPLLDMLSSREVCYHKEAYVRRSVLFAASCVLMALHPSYVASALVEGNPELSKGLEWVRTWALNVADTDTDKDCYTMAMTCLQLHAEMALQASRALETSESTFKTKSIGLSSNMLKGEIKIPHPSVQY